MNFSQKMERLEQVLRRMERDTMPLEETLALYEEGQKLLADCREFLTKAEGTVQKLAQDGQLDAFEARQ